MKMSTLTDAQAHLSDLMEQSRMSDEPVLLTDDDGHPLGLLTPVNEDDIDDMLAKCPSFMRMIEQRRACPDEKLLSHEQVLAELARLED